MDGKDVVVDSNEEMDEIKRKEEEAFAQALGYSVAPTVKKSAPKVSTEELKDVITASNSNYNDEQGGIGYSTSALKDFKDSIKDHLKVPVEPPAQNNNQSNSESKRGLSREDELLKSDRRRSPSPLEERSRRRRSPSPKRYRDNAYSRKRYKSPRDRRGLHDSKRD